MKISVVSGDIVQVPADALITAINSGGLWFGGIDRVIDGVAGEHFHRQALAAMPLHDGQVVVATGDGSCKGCFRNVIFVVDDLQQKLSEIIYKGLCVASDVGYKSVSLPTIRMGVMLGEVEKTVDEAVNEMSLGVRRFIDDKPDASIEIITFVVYRDVTTKVALESVLSIASN